MHIVVHVFGKVGDSPDAEKLTLRKGSAVNIIEHLHHQGLKFDFAFCDPPYNKGWVQKVLQKMEHFQVLEDGGYLIIEHSKHDEIGVLAACFELVRQEPYGETLLSFIRFAKV